MRTRTVEKIAYIALAGAAGTLTRYGVGTLFQRDGLIGMPWGIFAANMIGALLFGVIWAASEERGWIGENMRVIALVGFLGAFTTFRRLLSITCRWRGLRNGAGLRRT